MWDKSLDVFCPFEYSVPGFGFDYLFCFPLHLFCFSTDERYVAAMPNSIYIVIVLSHALANQIISVTIFGGLPAPVAQLLINHALRTHTWYYQAHGKNT
jgi:hypothetical protein